MAPAGETGTIRTFIACPLADETRERVRELMTALKRTDAEVKWVRPESMHLTLRFLGDVHEDRVPELDRAMAAAAAGISPIEVEVAGWGTFPPNKRPRVIWLGLKRGGGELAVVFERLEAALKDAGFGPADKPFSPHLTLGRVRGGRGLNQALGLLTKKPPEAGAFSAGAIVLYRSVLDPKGAVYTRLAQRAFTG